MINLIEIANAWITSYNPTPEQKHIAEVRINTCNGCNSKKYMKLIDTWVCGECSCPLNKVIFTKDKSKCKLNKWKI